MSTREHRYATTTRWTGNLGEGTANPRSYQRQFVTTAEGRPPLLGSSDPTFRGDADRWNPELLLVAALSQCHLLWYLHVCAVAGVRVVDYSDDAEGVMLEDRETGGGAFAGVTLRPVVTVADAAMVTAARGLHQEASERCFIAASVNFPVRHEPRIDVAS